NRFCCRRCIGTPLALYQPVDAELAFKTISYGLVGLIWLIALALLWISMRKEARYGQPLRGILGLIVAALCLCAFIVLVAAYVQKARSLRKISHRVPPVTSSA